MDISDLIVVGEGERLEDSLIGEGVAWLLIDTDVLRNMVMINLRPLPASQPTDSPCRTPDWRCESGS